MPGVRPTTSDVDIDLAQLFAALGRKWPRILAAALILAAAAFAYALFSTPLYRAETRILIESRESVFTRPSGVGAQNDQPLLDEQGVASQVEVIASADILRDVARSLDLASREEFGASSGLSSFGSMLVLLGLRTDPAEAPVEERVLRAVRERLSVYRVATSRVIVVQFSSEDPRLAAAVPNAIADAYLAVQQRAMLMSNEDATEWLEPEIADLRERVREAEARVAQYRAETDLFEGQGTAGLSTQQLSELSSELSRVRAARSTAEARAEAVRAALSSGAAMDNVPEVLASPMMQRLRERRMQTSAQIADLSATLLDNHPRLRALRAQLREIDTQVRAEMEKVLAGLGAEATATRGREEGLEADVARLKAEAARAGEDEVGLRALEREAAAQRALLETYLTRYREAASRADRNYLPVDARVFARATMPADSYFPRTVPIVGAAFVAGLLLMSVFTLLRELFSGRAMRAAPGAAFEPVEQVEMTRPVAATALEEEPDPIFAEEGGEEGEELSVAVTAAMLMEEGFARAVFVSPEGDEATAASVMVAREMADRGLRVLFLDLTWSGAPSASMLDSQHFPGITNLLTGEAQFSDIIRGDLYSECHVIPAGTGDPERAVRALDRLPIVMDSLTTAYDIVVVECGPSDAESIERVWDGDACVLVGVIEPGDEDVALTAADLEAGGYGQIWRVTPADELPPASGRNVA